MLQCHALLKDNGTDKYSSLQNNTLGESSGTLRDVLNQESLVWFSMMQKMQVFTMDIIEIKRKNNFLMSKVDALTKEQEAATKKKYVLERENEKLRHQISVLQEETTVLNTTEKNLKKEMMSGNTLLMSKFDTLKEEQTATIEESENLRQDMSVIRENIIALNTSDMNWKNVLETQDAAITDLQNVFVNLRSDVVQIRESMNDTNKRLDNLNTTNAHLLSYRVNGK
jgi:chromosome segregation ATPase